MKVKSLIILSVFSLSCTTGNEDSRLSQSEPVRITSLHSEDDRELAHREQKRLYSITEVFGIEVSAPEGMQGETYEYKVDNYSFYFGYDKNWEYHLQVKDKQNHLVSTHTGMSDSQIFNPTFYQTDYPGDPTVILIEGAGCGESWGNTVLIEYQDQFVEIGHLDVATRYGQHNEEFADNIAPFTEISIYQNIIDFKFTINDLVLYNDPIEYLENDELAYRFKDGELLTLR